MKLKENQEQVVKIILNGEEIQLMVNSDPEESDDITISKGAIDRINEILSYEIGKVIKSSLNITSRNPILKLNNLYIIK